MEVSALGVLADRPFTTEYKYILFVFSFLDNFQVYAFQMFGELDIFYVSFGWNFPKAANF